TAMALPSELTGLLREAARDVARDPFGALTLQRRNDIVLTLGPHRRSGRGVARGLGLRRRFALAARCVRYALPAWEATLPEDATPQCLLAGAEAPLTRPRPLADIRALIDHGWAHGDAVSGAFADRDDDEGLFVALLAHAASRALWVAPRDERHSL